MLMPRNIYAYPSACSSLPCLAVSPQLIQTLLSGNGLENVGEGPLSTIISGLRENASPLSLSSMVDDEEGKKSSQSPVIQNMLSLPEPLWTIKRLLRAPMVCQSVSTS